MDRQVLHPFPKIHFEDNHVIVLSKPSGLLSQGEHTGADNLVDWARRHVGRHYVGLIHRLDRNASGLMILAKRTKAAQRLSQDLQVGKICRKYHALVCGNLKSSAHWQHFLKRDESSNKTIIDQSQKPNSALQVLPLAQKNLENLGAITLCEFELETGRSHQIRAQSAFEKLPLLGDVKYGGYPYKRLCLHSAFLSFEHPMSHEKLDFKEPQSFETFGF